MTGSDRSDSRLGEYHASRVERARDIDFYFLDNLLLTLPLLEYILFLVIHISHLPRSVSDFRLIEISRRVTSSRIGICGET